MSTVDDLPPRFTQQRRIVFAVIIGLAALLTFTLAVQHTVIDLRELARWWLLMATLALILMALFTLWGAMLSGFLVMLLFMGGAAQFYVTEPLWYPELYLPPRSAIETAMLGLVLIQAIISFAVLSSYVSRNSLQRVAATFGVTRIVLFLLLSGAFTVPILNYLRLDEVGSYVIQLIAGTGVLAANLATTIAIALTLPGGVKLPTGWRWAFGLAAAFLLATLLLEWFAFERVMHVHDELAYIFQARTYAGGSLFVPSLPEGARDAFAHYLLETQNERWISVFTPGWPAVLALGVLIGAPWLINPVLGTASILLAYGVLRKLADVRLAAIGTLLLATSPWLIAMSASLMAHTLTLFLFLLAWLLILGAEEARLRTAALMVFAAGLAMGWMFLSRNLDGLLLGIMTGLFLLWRGGVLRHPVTVFSYSAGCVAAGGLIFLYNIYLTGDPLLTPLSDYMNRIWPEGANAFGFGENLGPVPGWDFMELREYEHSPFEGFVNTLTNISALHADFLGWGLGSLALVWAFLLYGRIDGTDRMMIAIIMVVIVVHAFYWFAASFYIGPRYWFMTLVPLVILASKGFVEIGARLEAAGFRSAPDRLNAVLLVLCLFSITVFLSYRGLTRYHDHRAYGDHYRLLALPETTESAEPLVLIKTDRQAASAYFMNDPWFPSNKPIYAANLGAENNAAVIAAFPDRPVLYYDETSNAFRRE